MKRECQFSESLHPSKRHFDFVFRERSIDDGSHFDPRLDKYPENQQKSRSMSRTSPQSDDGKKSDKKFNSLKKVTTRKSINEFCIFISSVNLICFISFADIFDRLKKETFTGTNSCKAFDSRINRNH